MRKGGCFKNRNASKRHNFLTPKIFLINAGNICAAIENAEKKQHMK
jgi:hypothetical protein